MKQQLSSPSFADLYDMVLNEINRQLEQQGVIVKRGAIVDASITDSHRRPRGPRSMRF